MGKLVLQRGWIFCLTLLVLACQSQPIAPKILFVDSSEGLPQKEQWRHRLAVADLDDNGSKEIIAPPARKEPTPRPHIWSRTPEGRWQEWQEEFPPWSYSPHCSPDIIRDSVPSVLDAAALHPGYPRSSLIFIATDY